MTIESRFLKSWNEEELGKVPFGELCCWEQNLFRLSLHDTKIPVLLLAKGS